MTALSDVLLSAGFLVHCLNVAIASVVACAIAVALSRRTTWSLPVRHALLVAALAASLTAPLVIPLFHVPSFWPSLWAIRVSETSESFPQPPKAVAVQPTGIGHEPRAPEAEAPLSISIPVAAAEPGRSTSVEPAATLPVSAVPDPMPLAAIREQRSAATTEWARILGALLCGVWFAGIAAGMLRAILCVASCRRWMQTVSVAGSPLLSATARRAADGLGLRNEITVYHSNLLPAPITFGLIRPRIVVPAGIELLLPLDQLRAVIQHEMAHVARRDLWIGLLQQVAQIGFWWNPLVRLANSQLADLREQICDDIAIHELPEPGAYATTLINIAERCSLWTPIPTTLGFGSSPARQLESRIRRILSSPQARSIRLSRRAAVGVSAVAVLMAATILFAQVQIETSAAQKPDDLPQFAQLELPGDSPHSVSAKPAGDGTDKAPADPSLHDVIQQMAAYEQGYPPFQMKVMETFRMSEGLTPQERARYPWADGRKHQRLMEYAQLAPRIWRKKETHLIDDEVEARGPWETFCDGERIVQASPQDLFRGDGKKALRVNIKHDKHKSSNYLLARPIHGVFCLAGYGELFSQAFREDEEKVDLAWVKGDAKLTFVYGTPQYESRRVLWLSGTHAWHPIRMQTFSRLEDKQFHDEWEVTKLVQRAKQWRVVEGTHRYRDGTVVDAKIIYSVDFKVLEAEYGSAVAQGQFQFQIPEGADVRDDKKPEAEPPPPAKTREITVTVVDLTDQPIPNATVRLRERLVIRELDLVTTDENGVARSVKAPQDDVAVEAHTPGFRPAMWILGAGGNELRVILTPQTPGLAVDEEGNRVPDAWISNETLQLRADGIAYVPDRDSRGKENDWSDGDGRFELTTNLTLRKPDNLVPFIAIDSKRDLMAIQIVPARELGQQQRLVLQPVCRVHGHCLLEGITEAVEIRPGLRTPTGETIASVTTKREVTPDGLRVDFQLRLPAGDYVLKSGESSHHSGFTIPFTIPAGQDDLDLETKSVPAAGPIALKGKPAPELEVEWRPGQQTSWEKRRGKVVVLDFWGTWCGPCVADMPMLMEIADQFRDKPVEWLFIHTANLKDFEDFDRQVAKCQERNWNNRKLPFTTVIDRPLPDERYSGKTSERHGVAEWPTLIVIDQQGKILGPVHKNKLAETISHLLGDGPEK